VQRCDRRRHLALVRHKERNPLGLTLTAAPEQLGPQPLHFDDLDATVLTDAAGGEGLAATDALVLCGAHTLDALVGGGGSFAVVGGLGDELEAFTGRGIAYLFAPAEAGGALGGARAF